tara:strand:+ start:7786 stop:8589 length:804 start_codon:yes stop_codon:yes gene_type:complete
MNLETLLSNTVFYRNKYLRLILLKIYHIIIFSPIFWFRKGPKLIINGVPKSGTHLLTSVLNEIPNIKNTRYGINMWMIDYDNKIHCSFTLWNPSKIKFIKKLGKLNGNQFLLSHLPYHKKLYEALIQSNVKMININRNRDDILISNFNYIDNLKRHYAHDALKSFENKSSKLNALRNGFVTVEGYVVNSHEVVCDAFQPWENYNDKNILNINFEELAGSKKGFSDELRKVCIKKILIFLDISYDDSLVDNIHKKALKTKSFTLRSFT